MPPRMGRGAESIGAAMALEIAPAALFGGGVAVSAASLLAAPLASPAPLAVGAAALFGAWAALRRLAGSQRHFPLPSFEQPVIELVGEAEAVEAPGGDELPELLLDELPELLLEEPLAGAAGARVVQLFGRRLPTPGQLRERIEQHLAQPRCAAPADASRELHEALAALRRSLR